jgi:hypothetical protein
LFFFFKKLDTRSIFNYIPPIGFSPIFRFTVVTVPSGNFGQSDQQAILIQRLVCCASARGHIFSLPAAAPALS